MERKGIAGWKRTKKNRREGNRRRQHRTQEGGGKERRNKLGQIPIGR